MRKHSKKIAAGILVFALIMSLAGCTTYDNFKKAFIDKKVAKVIKIGVFEPLTGSDAELAADEIKGMKLANALYPSAGKIPIELIYEDNQSQVDIAASAARTLADDGVSVVLGSYSSVLSLAGSDVFEERELPAVAATCMNPLVTQSGDFYFRVCFAEAYQGISAARYIYDSLGISSFAALKASGDDYAKAMIEQLKSEVEKLTGGEGKVTVVEYPADAENLDPYIKRLATVSSGAVFFPSTAAAANKVIKAARSLGYFFNWVGPGRWAGIDTLNPEGENSHLNGISYITEYSSDAELSPRTEGFNRAWRRIYGTEDKPSDAVALGFDAYLFAREGLINAEDPFSGKAVRRALLRVRDFPGATGKLTMGRDGDPLRDVVVVKYNAGEIKSVYTVNYDRDIEKDFAGEKTGDKIEAQ